MEFRVHWLSLTIWCGTDYAVKLWEEWFEKALGPMQQVGHGGRGFKQLYQALGGAKLYAEPVGRLGDNQTYVHFEFPGSACDALEAKLIQEFIVTLTRWEEFRISRLDLAWDGVGFSPLDVKQAVEGERIRSLLKRKSLFFAVQPFEEREDGSVGTSSLRLGSLSSARMLRVYDKRGPVRLEFQTRAERADLVAREVLVQHPDRWALLAIAHLRDYVDFEDEGVLLAWWAEFVGVVGRAWKTVTDARRKELERITLWLMSQVAPTFSAWVDLMGQEAIQGLYNQGKQNRKNRFEALLIKAAK